MLSLAQTAQSESLSITKPGTATPMPKARWWEGTPEALRNAFFWYALGS